MGDLWNLHGRVPILDHLDVESDEKAAVHSVFHEENAHFIAPRVSINAGKGSCRVTMDFSPDRARQLAKALQDAANEVEPLFHQWRAERVINGGKEGKPCSSQ